MGLGTLAIIALLARWPRVPAILVAVIAALAATAGFGLERQGVAVLGELPQGLPAFAWPVIGWSDLGPIIAGGLAVAFLASAETAVLSRSYAARLDMRVDQNQEMTALGAANIMAGLFQGFPISSSASRTPVLEAAGGRSQVAVVVGALAVAALLVWAPGLLRDLPQAALAAVVIAAVCKLFSFRELLRLHRMQPWECWLSVGCSLGVVMAGPITGIGLAVVLAVIEFLWDGWRPYHTVLGRVDGMKGYHDIRRHPKARRIDGLVLFRWDAPLFFANADGFQTAVLRALQASPTPPRWLVIAAEPITSVDITAADMLAGLDETLRQRQVQLCFAELKDPVKDKLRRFELYSRFDAYFFTTVDGLGIGGPGIAGQQRRAVEAPERRLVPRPGQQLGGSDQQWRLQGLPGRSLRTRHAAVDGGIDLLHARVQGHQHGLAVQGSGRLGHGHVRHHGQHGDVQPHRHALGHAASHPQSGKAARPLAESHAVQRGGGQAGLVEQAPRHGQQAFGVFLGPFVLQDGQMLRIRPPDEQGHAAARGRCFKGEQVQVHSA